MAYRNDLFMAIGQAQPLFFPNAPVNRGVGSVILTRPMEQALTLTNLRTGSVIATLFPADMIYFNPKADAAFYGNLRLSEDVQDGDQLLQTVDGEDRCIYTVREYTTPGWVRSWKCGNQPTFVFPGV